MNQDVALFCRPPISGRTKTRLIPSLGEDGAAALYRAFVADAVRTVEGAGLSPVVWWSEAPSAAPAALGLPCLSGVPAREQQGSDLGLRMADAIDWMRQRTGIGVVLGTDAPSLPPSVLRMAVDAFAEPVADVVLGLSSDGGYYLVASRVETEAVFSQVRWSTPHTLADTLTGAQRAGVTVRLLPPWYDVDTPADVALLRTHLTLTPEIAPETAKALGLRSVKASPG